MIGRGREQVIDYTAILVHHYRAFAVIDALPIELHRTHIALREQAVVSQRRTVVLCGHWYA